MVKKYKVREDTGFTVDDEQKTVEIEETKQVTTTKRTTVAQLKEEYKRKMQEIRDAKKRINEIIAELEAIRDNTDLSVRDIPKRVQEQ